MITTQAVMTIGIRLRRAGACRDGGNSCGSELRRAPQLCAPRSLRCFQQQQAQIVDEAAVRGIASGRGLAQDPPVHGAKARVPLTGVPIGRACPIRRKLLPRTLLAAVAPRQTTISGFEQVQSCVSHWRQARACVGSGVLCRRCLPRCSKRKCCDGVGEVERVACDAEFVEGGVGAVDHRGLRTGGAEVSSSPCSPMSAMRGCVGLRRRRFGLLVPIRARAAIRGAGAQGVEGRRRGFR